MVFNIAEEVFMFSKCISIAAAGMLVSGVALAQNAAPAAGSDTAMDAGTTPANAAKTESLKQEMKSTLQQAGFSNVRVMPDSFLVQAKDKSGHPVAMIINPNSMTEIVDEGTMGQTAAGQTAAGQTAANGGKNTGAADSAETASADNGGQTGGMFTDVPKQEKLSSSVVGMNVYNAQKQDIGTIKDIAYGPHGVKAYILGVGGFLGMGDHYVAVQPSAVNFTYDHGSNQWQADVNATEDQLKQAPAFSYPNQG
jgi:hypothetical protein